MAGKTGAVALLSGFKGYKASYVTNDIVAGFVIAALSIPIAMGYASIAGLPVIYGLYASIIAPFVFALITITKHIVFGMDSAASAMTGGMLASVGIMLGTQQTVQVMPLLTLLTAGFLLLFFLLKAGRVIRLVPIPVMHGFIVGISLSVILSQIPQLTGTHPDTSGAFLQKITNIFYALPLANTPSVILSIGSLVCLITLKKAVPRIPGALVVLLIASLATAGLSLTNYGVVTLEAAPSGFCLPTIPTVEGFDPISVVLCAFAIALVVALESLLCLETFSMRKGIRANGDRELLSFGLANVVVGVFGCPPCSASISRTAASVSSGGRSQLSSMVSAVVIAVVALACGQLLVFLPRASLSAIVVLALIEVCDFKKIRRYATKMPFEFAIFLTSTLVVFVWGAIPGIIAGFAISVLFLLWRRLRKPNQQLLGAVPSSEFNVPEKGTDMDLGFNLVKFKMEGSLSFLNIDSVIDQMLAQLDDETEALVIKMSKVDTLDTTATDKLLQTMEMLRARGIHVKLVRKLRPTNDHYTRFELRTLMSRNKFYPNVRTAIRSLSDEIGAGLEPQKPSAWIEETLHSANASIAEWEDVGLLPGDRPIVAITDHDDELGTLSGKLSFMQSKEAFMFKAAENDRNMEPPFIRLLITRASNGELVAQYKDGKWSGTFCTENLRDCIEAICAYSNSKA